MCNIIILSILFQIYFDAGVRGIKLSGIGISSNPKWERGERERGHCVRYDECVYVREWLLQEYTCVYVWSTISFFFFFANRSPFADLIRYKSTWHIFFQLLDTLPVCQDFNRQVCNRPACKFIHLNDGELFVIGKHGLVLRY